MWMPREPLVFGEALEAVVLERGFDVEGDLANVVPEDAGAGVEIDAELVGLVEGFGADGVGVELHAAEIDDPGEAGEVVDDDLVCGAAGRKGEGDGAEECGEVVGGALLVEGLAGGAVDEALEDDGAVLNSAESPGADRQEIADEVDLAEVEAEFFLGEVEFFGVGDADFVAFELEEFGVVFFGHEEG